MNNVVRKDLALEIDEKPGYKKTKLGWIPEEWEVSQLKMHSKIDVNNLSSKTAEDYTFRYISLSDINNGVINDQLETFKFENAPSRARRIVKNEDVLLATVRPNLKAFGIILKDSNNLIASTGFAVISPKTRLSSKFLFYYLFSQKMESQLYSLVVGSNYPAINSSDVRNLNIVLPPLPEQQKIATILSTWDKAIELMQHLIEAKEEQKKGLMQRLLTGKVRVKGYYGAWETFKIKEISDVDMNNLSNTTSPNYEFTYISLSDVNKGKLNDSLERIKFKNAPSRAKRIVEKEDILLTTVRPNLQAFTKISKNIQNYVASTGFAVITTNKRIFDVDYLYQYLFSSKFMRQIESLVVGSSYPAINSSDVKNMKIFAPKIKEEQTTIAAILTKADNEIDLLNQKLKALREQKKGLMQVLLMGKIRVE